MRLAPYFMPDSRHNARVGAPLQIIVGVVQEHYFNKHGIASFHTFRISSTERSTTFAHLQ